MAKKHQESGPEETVLSDGARLVRRAVVGAAESGPHGRIKLVRLLDHLQETAAHHAARLGASVLDLLKNNLTWVLSRYHVEISRYPLWGEEVFIATWPSAREGLYALREFEVKDREGRRMAGATSSWMLIDLKKKRPVSVEDNLPDYPLDPSRAVDDDFSPLPRVTRVDREIPVRVRMSDLDWNRHANHVAYIEWSIETAPWEILASRLPQEIEIDYRGEAFLGDDLLSRVECVEQNNSVVLVHQIVRRNGLKELARARTRWKS